jgi:hypothetical protein
MTNPTDNQREARIRQRFGALLRAAQSSDMTLFGHDLDAFVRDLSFLDTAPGERPQFRIMSNNLPPDSVMRLVDQAVDEVLAEEGGSS